MLGKKNIMVKVTTTPGKYPSSYFYFYLSLLLLWHTVYSHPPIPWVKNYSRLPPLSSLKPFQLSTTEKCTLSQKLSKIYWHIFDLMCKLKANGWTGSWKKANFFSHLHTLKYIPAPVQGRKLPKKRLRKLLRFLAGLADLGCIGINGH